MERPERADRRHDPAEDRAMALLRNLETLRTDEPKLAEPMDRLMARLIDLGVEAAVFFVVGFAAGISLAVAGHGTALTLDAPVNPVRSAVNGAAFLALSVFYVCYELGYLGRSLSKRVLSLKVVGEDGKAVSGRQLAKRSLAWLGPALVAAELWSVSFPHPISAIPFTVVLGIGASLFVSMVRDDAKRGWHDHLARTKVVTPR
jgi:uncharacterized RDD family membrane protein YckC